MIGVYYLHLFLGNTFSEDTQPFARSQSSTLRTAVHAAGYG